MAQLWCGLRIVRHDPPVTRVVRQLLYLLDRRDKVLGIGLLAMMLLGGLLEALGVALIFPFLALISDPEKIEQSKLLVSLGDIFGLSGQRDLLILVAVALLTVTVFKALYMTLLFHVQYKYIFRKQHEISRRLFSAYLFTPYSYHLRRNSAELLRNSGSEVQLVFMQVMAPITYVIVETTVALVLISLLAVLAPGAAIAALVVIGGIAGASQLLALRRLKRLGPQQLEAQGDMIKAVNQGLGGIKETKVLGREQHFADVFGESAIRFSDAVRFLRFATDAPRVAIEGLLISGILLVVIVLLATGAALDEILPTIGLFAIAAIRMMPSSSRIITSLNSIRFYIPSLEAVAGDLRELDEIELTRKTKSVSEVDDPIGKIEEVVLEDASYRYEGADGLALDDISLRITAGESIGIVGPSGAGKTTLVDILLGLLPPTSGRVVVNGRDVSEHLGSWQRRVGYIPQPVYLIDDTVRRNVAFGLNDDEIDDQRLWRALESAQLAETIRELPDGLDGLIGEHGTRISGGQRQRVGIARAIYHDADVLVLDEATAALDNTTEQEVTRAVTRFSGAKTVITIAHRLSSVQGCDRLYFIRAGRLEASGTYDELAASSDAFRAMALIGADED